MAIGTKDTRIFKALCDENRLRILELLQSGERCACKLQEELNIGQSTLSHHMRILCESGIVGARKEGKWVHYYIDVEGRAVALTRLAALTACTVEADENSPCRKERQVG